MQHPLFALPLLALALTACGGNVNVGSGGTAGGGGTGGSSGGGTACPANEPNGQEACDVPDVRCTYGDSVRPECRNDWTCLNGTWTTTKSVCAMTTTCPDAQPAEGADCASEGDVCTYGDALCECNACTGGPCMQFPKWQCAGPPTTEGCPSVVPNDGSACSNEGLQCNYGNPCGISGASVLCKNGAWLWVAIPCPA